MIRERDEISRIIQVYFIDFFFGKTGICMHFVLSFKPAPEKVMVFASFGANTLNVGVKCPMIFLFFFTPKRRED